MRYLLTVLSLILLGFCSSACTTRKAQVAVQTALNIAGEGVESANVVITGALPAAAEDAAEEASQECAHTCPDESALVLQHMQPWIAAVTGVRHATDTLHLLQAGLTLWIDTGVLPDLGPVCADTEEVFGSLLTLLAAVGVTPPALLTQVVPHVDTACTLVVSFARQSAGGE